VSEIDACDYRLSAHSLLGKGAGLSDLANARDAKADDARLAATRALASRSPRSEAV
jgi:hypothetical protein